MATTTKWGLRYPVSTDTADVPRDMQNLANDLDSVSMYYSGPISGRSAIAHKAGKHYHATDTQQYFVSDGTAWQEIPLTQVGTADMADKAITSNKWSPGAMATESTFLTNLAFNTWVDHYNIVGSGPMQLFVNPTIPTIYMVWACTQIHLQALNTNPNGNCGAFTRFVSDGAAQLNGTDVFIGANSAGVPQLTGTSVIMGTFAATAGSHTFKLQSQIHQVTDMTAAVQFSQMMVLPYGQ